MKPLNPRGWFGGSWPPPRSRLTRAVFSLGLGKAAEAMTRGAAEELGDYEAALVITKRKVSPPVARFTVLEAGHPVPDDRSIAAGEAALDFVSGLEPQDLLVCLVSGGGSALATAPMAGISLGDLQELTFAALKSGADIEDVNNMRRCLDRLKGGGLAAATRAQVLGVVLSDVIGDHLDAIASGPTVPGMPDPVKAAQLLGKLRNGALVSFGHVLKSSAARPGESAVGRIRNVIVGNAGTAAEGAYLQALRGRISGPRSLTPDSWGGASGWVSALVVGWRSRARRGSGRHA